MKIYFTASVRQKDRLGKSYGEIVKNLRNLGHDVIADHILYSLPVKIGQETREEKAAHYRQVARWINDCDLVVVEISQPASAGIGFEISQSLVRGKPVLALHRSKEGPDVFGGSVDSRLVMGTYDPPPLSEILPQLINEVELLTEVRFNFYLPADLDNYLQRVAKKENTSKAEFLRSLIGKYREKNPLD